MNITFLIGNGFDLNLGLDTKYSDFLEEYLKDNPEDTPEIKTFKDDIRKREEKDIEEGKISEHLWANVEIALGQYTDEVVRQGKTVEVYFERYDDFCTRLAEYLIAQEKRIDVAGYEQRFIDAILGYRRGLTEVQADSVNKSEAYFDGGLNFNFIIFNYTKIIDRIINAIPKGTPKLGTRSYRNTGHHNGIGQKIHVHGTTTHDMVLGVNDESQIGNMELFENAPPFYINSLIKQKTNQGNEARIDEKTRDIIKASSFIYIYGMSLGDTDAIWWKRIIARMKEQPNTHVFIYCYDAPKSTLLQRTRWMYDDNVKKRFLSFGNDDVNGLESRIHVVSTDIFAEFGNIAAPSKKEDTPVQVAAVIA